MKKFVLSKKYWILTFLLPLAVFSWYQISSTGGVPGDIETGLVKRGEVVEVVSETGFVKAAQAVDMAFESSGRVMEIFVQEGSEVMAGDALVKLDTATAAADVTVANARLEAEKIRLRELIAGADDNSLAVTRSAVASAETTLKNAEQNLKEVTAQQDQLVLNAEKTLRTSNLQAYLVSKESANSDDSFIPPVISGVYDSKEEGVYRLELYPSGGTFGASYKVTGLENFTGSVSTLTPTALGTKGLYIQFPNNFTKNAQWEIPIPNTRSSIYTANLNAYQSAQKAREVAIVAAKNAIELAKKTLVQATTQLTQVSSSARSERILAQQALVRQMQALADAALISFDNLTLKAPFAGTVSKINTEVGQIISPTQPVVSLISNKNYELTVNISEVDIAEVTLGDSAVVKFDAYSDKKYTAHVTKIAPNATMVDGVKIFTVTLAFDTEDEFIKDGLSANIDITTAVRSDVIALPTRAIYEDSAGKFVRSLTPDSKSKRMPVTTGLRGSNGLSEITSGLLGGETIITFGSEESITQLEKN